MARAILPQEVLRSNFTEPTGAQAGERFAFPSSQFDYNPPIFTQKKRPSSFSEVLNCIFGVFHSHTSPVGEGRKIKSWNLPFQVFEVFPEKLVEFGWDVEEGRLSKSPRDLTNPRTEEEDRCIARDAMRVAFEHLASRVVLALECERTNSHEPSNTVVVSGGVASNAFLRHTLSSYLDAAGFGHVQTVFPPVALCTDNAAMIGWAGCEMWEAGYSTPLSVLPISKWSLENLISEEGVYHKTSS